MYIQQTRWLNARCCGRAEDPFTTERTSYFFFFQATAVDDTTAFINRPGHKPVRRPQIYLHNLPYCTATGYIWCVKQQSRSIDVRSGVCWVTATVCLSCCWARVFTCEPPREYACLSTHKLAALKDPKWHDALTVGTWWINNGTMKSAPLPPRLLTMCLLWSLATAEPATSNHREPTVISLYRCVRQRNEERYAHGREERTWSLSFVVGFSLIDM